MKRIDLPTEIKKLKKEYPNIPYKIVPILNYIISEKNGKLHSYDDKPAVIYEDGTREWVKEGKTHRENGKPAIIYGGTNHKKYFEDGLEIDDKKILLFKKEE